MTRKCYLLPLAFLVLTSCEGGKSPQPPRTVEVKPYVRKDGTPVRGHTRRLPGSAGSDEEATVHPDIDPRAAVVARDLFRALVREWGKRRAQQKYAALIGQPESTQELILRLVSAVRVADEKVARMAGDSLVAIGSDAVEPLSRAFHEDLEASANQKVEGRWSSFGGAPGTSPERLLRVLRSLRGGNPARLACARKGLADRSEWVVIESAQLAGDIGSDATGLASELVDLVAEGRNVRIVGAAIKALDSTEVRLTQGQAGQLLTALAHCSAWQVGEVAAVLARSETAHEARAVLKRMATGDDLDIARKASSILKAWDRR